MGVFLLYCIIYARARIYLRFRRDKLFKVVMVFLGNVKVKCYITSFSRVLSNSPIYIYLLDNSSSSRMYTSLSLFVILLLFFRLFNRMHPGNFMRNILLIIQFIIYLQASSRCSSGKGYIVSVY